MRRKDMDKRIAALEASLLTRSSNGAKVIEQANLPEWAQNILLQALRGLAVISPEDSARLDEAIDALPTAHRTRVLRALESGVIVVVSGSDMRL